MVTPLTDDQLLEIERRAKWLSTSDTNARREDGEAMLSLVAEVRALRDDREPVQAPRGKRPC